MLRKQRRSTDSQSAQVLSHGSSTNIELLEDRCLLTIYPIDTTALNPALGGDGSQGFFVDRPESRVAPTNGRQTQIGDSTGDGISDLLFERYLVAGSDAGFPAKVDPTAVDGDRIFGFRNSDPFSFVSTRTPAFVGDVNGDDVDDFIIPANNWTVNSAVIPNVAFLVFGGAARLQTLDAEDGTPDGWIEFSGITPPNGYLLEGIVESTQNADFDGDDIRDLVLQDNEGRLHLIPGDAPYLQSLDAADGEDGFISLATLKASPHIRLEFEVENSIGQPLIFSLVPGDLTGDGSAELIVRVDARLSGSSQFNPDVWIVRGGLAAHNELDLSTDGVVNNTILIRQPDGQNLFRDAPARIRGSGDFNNDGTADLFVSVAPSLNIQFGHPTFLEDLDPTGSGQLQLPFRPDSPAQGGTLTWDLAGRIGFTFMSPDITGDGIDDLVVSGQSYVAIIPGGSDALQRLDAVDGLDGVARIDNFSSLPDRAIVIQRPATEFISDTIHQESWAFAKPHGDLNGDGLGDIFAGQFLGFRVGTDGPRLDRGDFVFGGTHDRVMSFDVGHARRARLDIAGGFLRRRHF